MSGPFFNLCSVCRRVQSLPICSGRLSTSCKRLRPARKLAGHRCCPKTLPGQQLSTRSTAMLRIIAATGSRLVAQRTTMSSAASTLHSSSTQRPTIRGIVFGKCEGRRCHWSGAGAAATRRRPTAAPEPSQRVYITAPAPPMQIHWAAPPPPLTMQTWTARSRRRSSTLRRCGAG